MFYNQKRQYVLSMLAQHTTGFTEDLERTSVSIPGLQRRGMKNFPLIWREFLFLALVKHTLGSKF